MQQQPVTFGRRGLQPAPQWTAPRPIRPAPSPPPSMPDATAVAMDGAGAAWLDRVPLGTAGLLVLLAVVFWLEQSASLEPPLAASPGYRSLIALGGVNARLVLHDGQVWRLLTAAWLHASPAHLIGNGVVLLLTGLWLERLLGRAWFVAVYAISGVGGAAASVLMNPAGPVSVGASGAITGLLGAAFVCSFHVAAHENQKRMRYWTLRLMVPALIPSSGHVDYSAHFGGVLTGVAIGYILQFVWPETQDRPNRAGVAAAVAGAWALASAGAFAMVALAYPVYVQRNIGLIPDAEMPSSRTAATPEQWAALNGRYPRDPLGALMTASAYGASGNLRAAEALLRSGLAETDVLDNDMSPVVRPMIEATLAATLMRSGQVEEARRVAAPLCQAPAPDAPVAKMVAVLRRKGLCD